MGLMELEAKLRSDAERELAEIKRNADSEVASVLAGINAAAERESARIVAEGERKAFLASSKILSDAKSLAMRNESLEKNKILDAVIIKAREKILALPDGKKAELLYKLSSNPVFEGREYRVLVDKKYSKLLKSKGKMKVMHSDLGDFGVILESADGLVRVDNRISVVLERLKPKLKPKLIKTLYGGT